MIIYKNKKEKKYLYDLVKYGNYISIGQENKYRILS